MPHRKWKFRIKHILEAIRRIEDWTVGISHDDFAHDEMRISAVVNQFQNIGEAIQHIPPKVRNNYPNIEWPKIRAMRNVLAHDYDKIDVNVVWDAVKNNLPVFKPQMQEVYEKETDD